VVAIGQDAPRPSRHPIHGTRHPRANRHHAASEHHSVARFDDEMRVIPLQ
jgi:hypothetical protein